MGTPGDVQPFIDPGYRGADALERICLLAEKMAGSTSRCPVKVIGAHQLAGQD